MPTPALWTRLCFCFALCSLTAPAAHASEVGDATPGYEASWREARGLAKAGLHGASVDALMRVLRAGPSGRHFEAAIDQLRVVRKRIGLRSPELEVLTTFSVAAKPQAFRDRFHYLVGELLYDFGLHDRALPYLREVSEGARDRPRARYLLGLLALQDHKRSGADRARAASRAFQETVTSAERTGQRGLVDLGYLALARLAYSHRQYDAALYAYRRISPRSPKRAHAFHEQTWTQVLKGDHRSALGSLHALHSPAFAHRFHPELWVLEATLYVQTCHYPEAKAAMARFRADVLPLAPRAARFLNHHRQPAAVYAAFVASVAGRGTHRLPAKLHAPVLGNAEFYGLHRAIRQLDAEQRQLLARRAMLGDKALGWLKRVAELRSERVAEAGVVTARLLRATHRDIRAWQDRLDELTIDLYEGVLADPRGAFKTVERKSVWQAVAGSADMVWPVEGEFWKDELGSYRSSLTSRCPERRAAYAPASATSRR